jgi:hypoxanthine phosphoribosyltransferase
MPSLDPCSGEQDENKNPRIGKPRSLSKQDPAGKSSRQSPVKPGHENGKYMPAPDGRIYFSYAQVHASISSLEAKIKAFEPDIIIAIGGGGFIPARMIRSLIKVPILAVSLELYDDNTCTMRSKVEKRQWFDESTSLGKLVRDGRVLVVDEVDDTRTTLQYCVEELMATNSPAAVAVAVVHNKLKPKKGRLPAHVQYFAGEDVEDKVHHFIPVGTINTNIARFLSSHISLVVELLPLGCLQLRKYNRPA